MRWIKKIMADRYGTDQLSMALLILCFLLLLVAEFSGLLPIMYVSYIPLAMSIYRTLSKQKQKRQLENYKFIRLMSPVYMFFQRRIAHLKDLKDHRYYKCPKCKQKLRVPRGKGRISITCPKCQTQFIKKT